MIVEAMFAVDMFVSFKKELINVNRKKSCWLLHPFLHYCYTTNMQNIEFISV